jgi:hypothetical protein
MICANPDRAITISERYLRMPAERPRGSPMVIDSPVDQFIEPLDGENQYSRRCLGE